MWEPSAGFGLWQDAALLRAVVVPGSVASVNTPRFRGCAIK